jgi:hypothetical protein
MTDTAPVTKAELRLVRVNRMNPGLTVAFAPDWWVPPGSAHQSEAEREAHEAAGGVHPGEEGHVQLTSVSLDADLWHAMGEPDQITLTVEPDDRLNREYPPGEVRMGPVEAVHHIAGRAPVTTVKHAPMVDDRPQHDDVTSDDVRGSHEDPPDAPESSPSADDG